MKATEAKLLDFLKKSPQFVIPIYQRTYSWTRQECAHRGPVGGVGRDDENRVDHHPGKQQRQARSQQVRSPQIPDHNAITRVAST